ncbi:MAG: DUF2974 domain-containing protein [Thomasclavelia sp.]|nr:DUF2974 domain-containing protein [Tissierellia bacterium]MDD8048690.1 DUF2974 domain-containing protein [Thomasclavelia sp.]
MTEAEKMLILNNLAYSRTFKTTNYEEKKKILNKSLNQTIDSFDKPDVLSDSQWKKVQNTIKNDDAFKDVKLKSIDYKKDKQVNILFSDNSANKNKALVVFKGTDTKEWHDNGQGGQWDTTDTPQQKEAKKFVEKKCSKDKYDEVVISGHSKGGNKAQYVAITNDYSKVNITKAYSFDGQGMNYPFMKKYKKQIDQNADKLYLYADSNDYVHALFNQIPTKHVYYTKSDATIASLLNSLDFKKIMNAHSPSTMLDFSGDSVKMKTTDDVKEDKLCKIINGLTDYLSMNLSNKDYNYFIHLIMHIFDKDEGCDYFKNHKKPKNFEKNIVACIYNYCTDVLKLDAKDTTIMVAILSAAFLYDNNFKTLDFTDIALNEIISKVSAESLTDYKVRDFSDTMLNSFLKLVKQSQDDEPIYEFWNWDVWPQVKDYFVGYSLEDANNSYKKYYSHMIDMEDMTEKQAKDIFKKVRQKDTEFSKEINNKIDELNKCISDIQDNLIAKIKL